MKYEQYKFKFYLNARHSIYINGRRGQTHPHTWEISIDTMKIRNGFIQFNQIESLIEKDLSAFQDSDLNETEQFKAINPTLENICVFFCERIENILNRNGWILLMIEVSETPARSYVINRTDEETFRKQIEELDKNEMQSGEYDENAANNILNRNQY